MYKTITKLLEQGVGFVDKSVKEGQEGMHPYNRTDDNISITLHNQEVIKEQTICRSFYGFWKV